MSLRLWETKVQEKSSAHVHLTLSPVIISDQLPKFFVKTPSRHRIIQHPEVGL